MPVHTHKITASSVTTGNHNHTWYSGQYGSSQYSAATDANGVGKDGVKHITMNAGSHSHSVTASAANTGGNKAHQNMPPFLSVYCWKRVS